jgi:hypothetical protein
LTLNMPDVAPSQVSSERPPTLDSIKEQAQLTMDKVFAAEGNKLDADQLTQVAHFTTLEKLIYPSSKGGTNVTGVSSKGPAFAVWSNGLSSIAQAPMRIYFALAPNAVTAAMSQGQPFSSTDAIKALNKLVLQVISVVASMPKVSSRAGGTQQLCANIGNLLANMDDPGLAQNHRVHGTVPCIFLVITTLLRVLGKHGPSLGVKMVNLEMFGLKQRFGFKAELCRLSKLLGATFDGHAGGAEGLRKFEEISRDVREKAKGFLPSLLRNEIFRVTSAFKHPIGMAHASQRP